jgi:DNA-binding response OmpR family regulator
MRLLLIEDSRRLQRSIGTGLRRAGYAVDIASDGQEGLAMAEDPGYDVIILDLMLPQVDGMTLLRRLRGSGVTTHVLILTARDNLSDKLEGLRGGADDYLIKPFALEELLARVQALARRSHGVKNPAISVGPLTIDTANRTVQREGQSVALSPREYAILEYLAFRSGRLVSRADIEAHVYEGRTEIASNAVDSAICALRRKIDAEGAPSLIETRRALGYVLRPDA